jgi:DNA-directed RNA polymerase subunit RPC12/RpoP
MTRHANLTPKCWNCGRSVGWTEVATLERCTRCGIECHYHGSGANAAYAKLPTRCTRRRSGVRARPPTAFSNVSFPEGE